MWGRRYVSGFPYVLICALAHGPLAAMPFPIAIGASTYPSSRIICGAPPGRGPPAFGGAGRAG